MLHNSKVARNETVRTRGSGIRRKRKDVTSIVDDYVIYGMNKQIETEREGRFYICSSSVLRNRKRKIIHVTLVFCYGI